MSDTSSGGSSNLNEITAHIDNFRQIIYCLNVLGRLETPNKIETPQQMQQRPWKIQIQDNTYSLRGLITRLRRTFGDHQFRENNFDYVKMVVEEARKEFTFLFQYISKYIVKNNKDAIQHWKHTPLLSFSKVPSQASLAAPVVAPLSSFTTPTKPTEDEHKLKLDETQWLPMQHICPLMTKDEKRTYGIQYRLCRCTDCALSSERMMITRVGELLVQGLASMNNARMGLDCMKTTYNDDSGIMANIQSIQMDLNNMSKQYVHMAIYDDDNECMIRFDRPFIDSSDERALP